MENEPDAMPTQFQKKVYTALRRIPRGRVTTYKLLAEYPACRSCRAVGQALKRNPYAPAVPCHRVIASDLTPGGFMGRHGGVALRRKLELLALEGIRFHAGKLAEPGRLFMFPGRRPHSSRLSQRSG
jgi:methylated-DNA-[protein]-cysteine S-methyltransferase